MLVKTYEQLQSYFKGDSTDTAARGLSIAGAFAFSGPQSYRISLGGFSEECGGAVDGFRCTQ